MLLRCRRRIVQDGIDDSRVTGTVMVRFRCVVVVRVFRPAPVHQWPILRRGATAAGTPRQHGRRHVVVGARDVGVARQQVRRRDEESAAGAATVSRFVDRSR